MKSLRDLINLCLRAWSSKHALRALPVALLVIFSIVATPLIEGPSNGGLFLSLLLPSAISAVPAVIALYVLWYLTFRNGDQPVWMLFAIVTVASAIRGASLHYAGQSLADDSVELPGLASRVTIAVISWNLTLGSFAVANYLVLSPTEKWYQLRRELADLDEEIRDSKLQLDWLVKRKVQGLEQQLREEFLALSQSMRETDAASYQELGAALRRFANESVRDRSKRIWNDVKERSPLRNAALRAITQNPLVPASVSTYFLGYLLNELRIYGLGVGLLAVLLGSASYLLLLLAARKLGLAKAGNLWVVIAISVLQGIISGWLYLLLLPERTESYALTTAVVATLWSMASLFISGWLTLSVRLYAAELQKLSNQRDMSENELAWLESQLQSTNREISKYLHGILQSRLMAHALSMEEKGDQQGANINQVLADLEQVMARPMDSFFDVHSDLRTELDRVRDRWQGFLELEFEELDIADPLANDATLQILQEALANASRHGAATKATISIVDAGSWRTIRVTDNGALQLERKPGLGSEIFNSLTRGNWTLESANGETSFKAVVPR